MKRYLGSFVVAALVLAWAAVPVANARFGGMSAGGSGRFGGGGFGGWHGRDDRGHFGHGGFHGYYGFYFGWPLAWYPYYWGPYYNYDYYYPPPYQYDYYNGYYPAPTYSYSDNTQRYAYPDYDRRDYLTLGHDSGKALKLQKVSREWLVDYLRAYIIYAPPSVRDDFRRGFVSGFGDGAESVLQKAMQDAGQPNPPGPPPPPRADAGPKSESTPPEKP
jgi:hypothetical protein